MTPMSDGTDNPELRRRLVQQAETGTLAELALTTYDQKATQAEQEAARSNEEQQRIRERWAAEMEAKQGALLTKKLASSLGIDIRHPALSGLTWYMDRDNLAEVVFSTPPGPVGIASESDFDKANLYAVVAEGVLIEAAPWGRNTASARFFITDNTKSQTRKPLSTLADLGQAITEAAQDI